MISKKTKEAREQAIKDMRALGLEFNQSLDRQMRTSGFTNPGFKRNSYKPL